MRMIVVRPQKTSNKFKYLDYFLRSVLCTKMNFKKSTKNNLIKSTTYTLNIKN